MPKLTGEELADLYPKAKTYNELEARREAREEQRRPKFVAEKIALYTSLYVPVAATAYYAAKYVTATTNTGSSMTVLAGVCGVVALGMVGIAVFYYLWSLIDRLVSKVMASTQLLYILLGTILFVAGLALFGIKYHDATLLVGLLAAGVFLTTYVAVHFLLKQELKT